MATGSTKQQDLELLAINTIRTLSMDAVQKAKSGHPGAPMGLAPLAYLLYKEYLRYNPQNPDWPNRDRFVLSNGHASMLLYSVLFLTGYGLTLEDLKQFRQWESKTPGHPEHGLTPGVETTTGPLGQGVGNAVGMAIAQRWLAAHFNRPGHDLVDYRVYAICGDGDQMEGVASEASSLAGHLRLSNLTMFYDNNSITIEGQTSLAFSEDVEGRYRAYGWNVLRVEDVNDLNALRAAIAAAHRQQEKPNFIMVKTHIGYGAPKRQDTKEAHGEPLGEDEVRAAKRNYGWPEDKTFYVPSEVESLMRQAVGRGAQLEQAWKRKYESYRQAFPELAKEWETLQAGRLPENWDSQVPVFPPDPKGMATRESAGKVENAIAKHLPWLIGGSADLAPSTRTLIANEPSFSATTAGRNMHFGIREHGMGAILNGMALSKLRVFGATFLTFSDYMRGAIRLAALMRVPVTYIFTHDSIGLGEDGPTHQPIEQLMSLRAIPRLTVVRPGDANEAAEAWRYALGFAHGPTAIALSRQPVPTFDRAGMAPASGLLRGAYVLLDSRDPEVILIGTGSELGLCVSAWQKLAEQGVRARVVSMPSWELFEQQEESYKDSVLPPSIAARVSVEAGITLGWSRYVGAEGISIGRDDFGASAPYAEVLRHFGFTTEHVVEAALAVLERVRPSIKARV
jgi:transketolase